MADPLDFVILQDNEEEQQRLLETFGEEYDYRVVPTSTDLHLAVRVNRAGIYFLDSCAPLRQGDAPSQRFLADAEFIICRNPGALIVYAGSRPTNQERRYCDDNKVVKLFYATPREIYDFVTKDARSFDALKRVSQKRLKVNP